MPRLTSRGHSSAGRAPALQAGGRRFEPGWLHPKLQGFLWSRALCVPARGYEKVREAYVSSGSHRPSIGGKRESLAPDPSPWSPTGRRMGGRAGARRRKRAVRKRTSRRARCRNVNEPRSVRRLESCWRVFEGESGSGPLTASTRAAAPLHRAARSLLTDPAACDRSVPPLHEAVGKRLKAGGDRDAPIPRLRRAAVLGPGADDAVVVDLQQVVACAE